MGTDRKFRLHNGKVGTAIAVRITPRASRNEVVEIQENGTIKIRLTAPPVEGQANQALISFLSDVLKVPESQISIVAGQTGKDKLVAIDQMDGNDVAAKLTACIKP